MSSSATAAKPIHQRPGEEPEAEGQALNDVPREQSARLLPEAMQPLQTEALERSWRTPLLSCEKLSDIPTPTNQVWGIVGRS